jgi:phytoene dehydrogenase-like protein
VTGPGETDPPAGQGRLAAGGRRSDVVVVGAGLAGLAAAVSLTTAGVQVALIEAAESVGGRASTDQVDGLLLDRGFQLLNPAYPAARRLLDLAALDLRPFDPGVVVATGGRRRVLADPWRSPGHALPSLMAPGSLREKAAFARWALRVSCGDVQALKLADDEPLAAALDRWGLDGRLRSAVIEPFLAGVLAEGEQVTSRRFVDLLVRSFVRGRPALPARGIQAMPQQLASRLPDGVLRLGVRARSVAPGTVRTDSGSLTAPVVVVATDPGTAVDLLGLPPVRMRGLTTYYHLAQEPPTPRRMLHLDGDRRGPVVNTAVVSNVAPSYAGGRGWLIASTVLGADPGSSQERAVRGQLRLIYGADPRTWDLVGRYPVAQALPAMAPPLDLRQPVDLGDGVFVAGDHRDTASVQGALASGLRTGRAVLGHLGLGPEATPSTEPTTSTEENHAS